MKDKLKKEVLKIQKTLVSSFTPEFIRNEMKEKDYVIGFGRDNKSFCYTVEIALNDLGSIKGANAKKFGFYYGKTKSDNIPKYRYSKRFGKNEKEAFKRIKEELASLVERASALNEFKDIESLFRGMFKYKVIYLYNQDIMIPSFYKEDLSHFARCLKIDSTGSFEELQKRLLNYRDKNMSSLSNHSFATFLYDQYGRDVSKEEIIANELLDCELNTWIYNNQINNNSPKKRKSLVQLQSRNVYPRDPTIGNSALEKAGHKCENETGHTCFIKRRDGKPYTEVHHLIPLAFQSEFEEDIDIEENIVSLCSSCHNEIHYGKDADRIIEKLFNQRRDALLSRGVYITLDRLLFYYHTINSKQR